MKKTVFLFFFLIITISFSYAQIKSNALITVDTLASDYMAGRGYVKNGVNNAAHFLQNKFREIGLKSFSDDMYFQDLSFPVNTFPGAMEISFDALKLNAGVDYIVEPSCPSIKGSFEFLVLKKEDFAHLKNIKHLKLKNKIIVLDERNYTPIDSTKEKIDALWKGFLNTPTGNPKAIILLTNKKLTWSVSTEQSQIPFVTISSSLDLKLYKKISLNIEAKHIDKYATQNVVGYIPSLEKSDTFIALVAHYDHLGMMGTKAIFPGANDNASGIAMLLEQAKYFSKNPLKKYNVLMICFTGEEIGLLGSQYFVENPLVDLKKLKFLINFDLAGTGEEGIKIVNGSIYKEQFEKIKQINTSESLLSSVNIRGKACNSDHCMFDEKGVPCFFIYTLGGIQAYHDVYDKAETLPLTAFEPYFELIKKFILSF